MILGLIFVGLVATGGVGGAWAVWSILAPEMRKLLAEAHKAQMMLLAERDGIQRSANELREVVRQAYNLDRLK